MVVPMYPDLVVNGDVIPQSAVAAELQNHRTSGKNFADALHQATNAMVIRTLLLQEATKKKLTAKPQEVGPNKFESKEEALIREILEKEVKVTPPGEAAIRKEWEKNPSRFRSMPLWEVSHILFKCDPSIAEDKLRAQARAQEVAYMLADNPNKFAEIAKNESDCGSSSSGGTLGQIRPKDTVPEFEQHLRKLHEGEITIEPVLTRHGYHIIRMDAMVDGNVLPFETVRQKISDAIEKAEWTHKAQLFIRELVSSAEIEGTNMEKIKSENTQHSLKQNLRKPTNC